MLRVEEDKPSMTDIRVLARLVNWGICHIQNKTILCYKD